MASDDKEITGQEARQLLRRSVFEPEPNTVETGEGSLWGESIIWAVGAAADGIAPWGTNIKLRDRQLRGFLPTEGVIASAIGSVVVRNAGFEWKVEGPERTAEMAHMMLTNAQMGKGWADFMSRLFLALYTQDSGAFVEIIRAADSPNAPVLGIQTLDPVRCYRTQDPEIPVVYQDIKGKFHRMAWYQVVHLQEMPAAHERLAGVQYSGLTRVMSACQAWKSINTYTVEKVSGRHNKAIHVVSGVQPSSLQAALGDTQRAADERGQTRYIQPAILTTAKAEVEPKVATIDLATLPDGFDKEKEFKLYMTIVSMGLFTDFQEFAPLPSGNMGSGMQSEILHLKSRGKGPQMARKLIGQMLNHEGILPAGVKFSFDEADYEAESAFATLVNQYSDSMTKLVQVGVYDRSAAQQFLLDHGILDQETFDRLAKLPDLTDPGMVQRPPLQTPGSGRGPESVEEEDQQKDQREDLERGLTDTLTERMGTALERIYRAAER